MKSKVNPVKDTTLQVQILKKVEIDEESQQSVELITRKKRHCEEDIY